MYWKFQPWIFLQKKMYMATVKGDSVCTHGHLEGSQISVW